MMACEARMGTNRLRSNLFIGLGMLFLCIGVCLCPFPARILEAFRKIVTHPAMVDFDSFYWTENIGASFVHAGFCVLIVMGVYRITHTEIRGIHITNIMMVAGFSFYGKNVLNMWFPMMGMFLYGRVKGKKPREVSAMAIASTCLGPVFSTLSFYTEPLGIGSAGAILVGIILSVLAGFAMGYFAAYFPKLHGGLLLYNAGMAAGWVAVILNSTLKAMGLGHEMYPYAAQSAYASGQNTRLGFLLALIFAYLVVAGLLLGGAKNGLRLLWKRAKNEEHLVSHGLGGCLVAMGLVGMAAVGYVLLIGGEINGTTFACIFAAMGFVTAGSTLRSHLPALTGVAIGAWITGGVSGALAGEPFMVAAMAKLASRGMVLAALFTCGVAPVAGTYGVLAGLIVGLSNSVLVPSIAQLHGWMSLYNNGLALGFVTTLLKPVCSICQLPLKRKSTIQDAQDRA